jgi:ParB family chromosome partitioning protein
MANDLQHLELTVLQPNPFQPRDKIKKEEISELIDSVKQHGVIEPLVAAHTPAGYQIIAGERRWRAAREAGLQTVPVYIIETTRKGMLELAIVENLQREDLDPLERAQAFSRLQSEFGLRNMDICAKVGKSPAYVSNTLKLLRLPDAIKDALTEEVINEKHARVLLQIPEQKLMLKVFRQIVKDGIPAHKTEELVRRHLKANEDTNVTTSDGSTPEVIKEVDNWWKKAKARLKVKSNFKFTRSNRQTKIAIILKGDPARTQADLERIMKSVAGEE